MAYNDAPSYLLNKGTTAWTPNVQINGSSTGITYSAQTGFYQQMGNLVFITGEVILTSKGAGSGVVSISNFPVAIGSTAGLNVQPIIVGEVTGWTSAGYTILCLTPSASSTIIWNFTESGSGKVSAFMQSSELTSTPFFNFSGIYCIA